MIDLGNVFKHALTTSKTIEDNTSKSFPGPTCSMVCFPLGSERAIEDRDQARAPNDPTIPEYVPEIMIA
jgi:hypothetical protein